MYFQPAKTLYSCAGIPGNDKRSHGGDVFQWNEITRTGRAWLQLLRPKGGATMSNISLVWIRMVFQLFQQKLGECRNPPHFRVSWSRGHLWLGFPAPKLDDPKVTRTHFPNIWHKLNPPSCLGRLNIPQSCDSAGCRLSLFGFPYGFVCWIGETPQWPKRWAQWWSSINFGSSLFSEPMCNQVHKLVLSGNLHLT